MKKRLKTKYNMQCRIARIYRMSRQTANDCIDRFDALCDIDKHEAIEYNTDARELLDDHINRLGDSAARRLGLSVH